MLLGCSPAHQPCQAVEAVETEEAVECCDFGAGHALRNALGDKKEVNGTSYARQVAVERL